MAAGLLLCYYHIITVLLLYYCWVTELSWVELQSEQTFEVFLAPSLYSLYICLQQIRRCLLGWLDSFSLLQEPIVSSVAAGQIIGTIYTLDELFIEARGVAHSLTHAANTLTLEELQASSGTSMAVFSSLTPLFLSSLLSCLPFIPLFPA